MNVRAKESLLEDFSEALSEAPPVLRGSVWSNLSQEGYSCLFWGNGAYKGVEHGLLMSLGS